MDQDPQPEQEPKRLDLEGIFNEQIWPFAYGHIKGVENSSVHLIGVQPGSGKSVLRRLLVRTLQAYEGSDTVMHIDGDDFRANHPEFRQKLRENEVNGALQINDDLNTWVEMARSRSLEIRPNVTLEGTLRDPKPLIPIIQRYKDHRYSAELHVLVVHEFVSRLDMLRRYLGMTANDPEHLGRYVTAAAHDSAYQAIPSTVQTLAVAGLFDVIVLHDRYGNISNHPENQDPVDLVQSIELVRQKPDLPRDQILSAIDKSIKEARQFNKQFCVEDLSRLKQDVLKTEDWET